MRNATAFGFALLLMACSADSDSNRKANFLIPLKVENAVASDLRDSISATDLVLTIRFVGGSPPLQKGLWPFTQDRLLVELDLRNKSDSALLVEPFIRAPLGNPSFSIHAEDETVLYGENLTTISVMTVFVEIPCEGSYRDTVDILKNRKYDFIPGATYTVKSKYVGLHEAFLDSAGRRRSVWNGHINSNTLRFTYPD